MRRGVMAAMLAVGLGLGLVPAAGAQPLPTSRSDLSYSFAPVVKKVSPAVVNIYTTTTARVQRRLPFPFPGLPPDGQRVQNSLGSGVLVKADGLIITNAHVVKGADEIRVVLYDRREFDAKLVTQDERYDLALLRIDTQGDRFPFIELRDSDSIEVGDVVLAIGNPFGVGQTVTLGIVSALGRNNLHINHFENFIQTDAAINFGNSGGALVDTRGNLLGINSAIYSQTGGSVGIGFAIPVTTAKSVMEEIIKTGQVVRGWIGIESQDITPEMAESFGLGQDSGAIIAGVVRGGPADRAGIRPGDILLSVNGKKVSSTNDMLNLIADLPPGGKSQMTVMRKNRQATLDVTVGRRPRQTP